MYCVVYCYSCVSRLSKGPLRLTAGSSTTNQQSTASKACAANVSPSPENHLDPNSIYW